MITTVTLNAAIDKTYYMDDFLLGKVNRMRRMYAVPGGKGINVAKVVQTLDSPVVAAGIIGGNNGQFIADELSRLKIANDFVHTETGESRLCLNIISNETGCSTEILEPGLVVSLTDLQLLQAKVSELAAKSSIVVFSGSIPQGVPDDIYTVLVNIVKNEGATAFLDTSGTPLLKGIESKPFFIKPNEDEIKVLLKSEHFSEDDLVQGIYMLMEQGIQCVAVTLGASGSIAGFQGICYRVRTPLVNAVNSVGCGDAFVAGMAVGFERNFPFEEIIKYASAVATANALTEQAGHVNINDVSQLLQQVVIERLGKQ